MNQLTRPALSLAAVVAAVIATGVAAIVAPATATASSPRQPARLSKPAPAFNPAASIQDLMVAIVDPAADALWDAVSTETTGSGVKENQPRTDEEWAAVRRHAIALQEAGNLLLMEGRAVTHAGKLTEDAHVDGVNSPAQITGALRRDRVRFNASAVALQNAAGEAVAAIDAKNPARLLAAGAKLDQACERCHSIYWYPNARKPSTAAWPAPLNKQ